MPQAVQQQQQQQISLLLLQLLVIDPSLVSQHAYLAGALLLRLVLLRHDL
jgi:hypothetical protein